MDGTFANRMSDTDALMWTIERDPLLRSTITAVLLLDEAPDRKRFRDLVDRGTRLIPRMRHRVRGNPYSLVPPRWEVDPNFDLDFHLRWIAGGANLTFRDVLDYAQPVAMQSFDRARPQWEIHVLEGLVGGGAAVVAKIHHAITDGVGAVQMAMLLFEPQRDTDTMSKPMPPEPQVHVLDPFARLIDGIRHEVMRERNNGRMIMDGVASAAAALLADPRAAIERGAEVASSVSRLAAPALKPMSTLMGKRSLRMHFETLVVPMDRAKAAAAVAGCSLNDAFVAAATAGLRRYHESHGASTGSLRMTMPINVRDADDDAIGGNRFVPARFEVPLVVNDPVRRMRDVHDRVAQQRAEPALELLDPLSGLLNRLPREVATGLFGSMLTGIDFVTSNVPGAPMTLYTAGARIDAMFAFGPLSGAAVNMLLLSYEGECAVGVNIDRAAVPDHDLLMQCLREGWDEILALAAG